MQEEFIRNNIKVLSHINKELSKNNSLLFGLAISGSHLYGFESEDSDVDYRGIFVQNTNNRLSLSRPLKNLTLSYGNNDIVLFELQQFLGLAVSGNCNVLEHLNADQVFNTSRFLELRQLINNSFGKKGIYDAYRGMATFNYKKFILGGRQNAKKYLYVFRSLMAGIHVLQTGKIEPNIETLNKYFKNPKVKELIKIKKQNREMTILPKELLDGSLEKEIDLLFDRIDKAYDKSKIPIKPSDSDIEKVNRLLVEIRKENLE